jgi:uncharacterized DUF497 family protein
MADSEFEWDENKNRWNIQERGFGFDRANVVFSRTLLVKRELRMDYGEPRYMGIGEMEDGVVIAVVYTIRGLKTRIISARVASKKERGAYYEYTRKDI